MFSIEFSSHAKKFLRSAEKDLVNRLVAKFEGLAQDPFPPDVKRIVNRKEKIFRVIVNCVD